MKNILILAVILFIILYGSCLAIEALPSDMLGGTDRVRIISERISAVGREAWAFARPLLQLIVILVILQSLLARYGSQLSGFPSSLAGDVKSLLALLVVAAFALAALAGVDTTGSLKDVALVVLGFYFGRLPPEKSHTAP
ncbi:MAG TPA: hypothetical protein VK581_08085 [Chthoniobacterales bacterium]|nr:hypothetical protein [Chthoniobacterales bacterium]